MKKRKIIFICNPNNPTGTIVDKEAVDRFVRQIPKDIIIVFDEAYYDYVEDENYPDSLSYVLCFGGKEYNCSAYFF